MYVAQQSTYLIYPPWSLLDLLLLHTLDQFVVDCFLLEACPVLYLLVLRCILDLPLLRSLVQIVQACFLPEAYQVLCLSVFQCSIRCPDGLSLILSCMQAIDCRKHHYNKCQTEHQLLAGLPHVVNQPCQCVPCVAVVVGKYMPCCI